jgi:hypothetical protein
MQVRMSKVQVAAAIPKWTLLAVQEFAAALVSAYESSVMRVEVDLYGLQVPSADPTPAHDTIRVPARSAGPSRVGAIVEPTESDDMLVEPADSIVERMAARARQMLNEQEAS